MPGNRASGVSADERSLFRDAVRDTVPLRASPRAKLAPPAPPPVPVQSLLDVHSALEESVSGPIPWQQSMETGEELSYLRSGLRRDLLRKLRRGHWVMQSELDLHGHNAEEARVLLGRFLPACVRRGVRCVRIVHGKGLRSPNREPVLKRKLRDWLVRRDDVLAFCQAPQAHGGSGAVLVLLKGS